MMALLLLAMLLLAVPCKSFSIARHYSRAKQRERLGITRAFESTTRLAAASTRRETAASNISIQTYEYDGWNLTYRYKPAFRGYENQPPLLLIHPVGIGLSSWFWNKFMEEWTGAAVFAPDLIGCGVNNGGDAFQPDKRGLSVPLGWVQGCEALMQQQQKGAIPSVLNSLPLSSTLASRVTRGWNVVCQGGLAPVGIMLAARNPTTVSSLVLTSPPTWKDMTTAIPESELTLNYNFLRNPLIEPLAFGLLETQWAIQYFSNLFLFADKCDDEWLDTACSEICVESRPPVQVFNAGFCNHRSFQEELESLQQPTLVISGDDDLRVSQRQEYAEKMKDCTLLSLPGQNVVPWESPQQVCNAVEQFCY